MIFTFLALLAVQQTVGPVIPVGPARVAPPGDHVVARGADGTPWISVATGVDAGGRPALRSVTLDPATGETGTPSTFDCLGVEADSLALAWNAGAGRFLLAFRVPVANGRGGTPMKVFGHLLDARGAPAAGAAPFRIDDDDRYDDLRPAIASNGSAWIVAWIAVTQPGLINDNQVWHRLLSAAPAATRPTMGDRLALDGPQGLGRSTEIAVSWAGGTDYLVAGCSEGSRRLPPIAALVSTQTGARTSLMFGLGDQDAENGRKYREPVLAGDPVARKHLLVCMGWSPTKGDFISFLRVRPDGWWDDERPAELSVPGLALGLPAVAARDASQGWFAAWSRETAPGSGAFSILAASLASAGGTPPGQPFLLADPGAVLLTDRFSLATGAGGQILLQWRGDPALPERPLLARVSPEPPPPAPTGLEQWTLDGSSQVDRNGTVMDGGVFIRARLGGPPSDSTRLQMEMIPAAAEFDGTVFAASDSLPGGSPVSFEARRSRGASYRWRVRARRDTGLASPWVAFTPDPGTPPRPDFSTRAGRAPRAERVEVAWLSGAAVEPGVPRFEEKGLGVSAFLEDADRDRVQLRVRWTPVFGDPAEFRSAWVEPGSPVSVDAALLESPYTGSYIVVDASGQESEEAALFDGAGGARFEVRGWGGSMGSGLCDACAGPSAVGPAWLVVLLTLGISKRRGPEAKG